MNESDKAAIEKLCEAANAVDFRFIDPESIVVAHWTRYKCQYGCGAYGKSRCCPPHTPTADETKKILSDYTLGLLVRFGIGGKVTLTMASLEREVFLMNYHKAIAFGAGPCKLCTECRMMSGCAYPDQARPSMEGCGIDVYATARNNGFQIHVLKDRDDSRNYFGLLMIE